MTKKGRSARQPHRLCIPQHLWLLFEVLITVLALHYSHVPVNDLISLLKLFL